MQDYFRVFIICIYADYFIAKIHFNRILRLNNNPNEYILYTNLEIGNLELGTPSQVIHTIFSGSFDSRAAPESQDAGSVCISQTQQ